MSMQLRVVGRDTVADRVAAFTLGRTDGGELPTWTPGSHIDLTLPGGLIRQYSLCSDPADSGVWRVAVLHEPDGRGGSVAAHHHLQVGSVVHAEEPRDNFGYRADAADVLFIAGGIGITPILSMVHAAQRSRCTLSVSRAMVTAAKNPTPPSLSKLVTAPRLKSPPTKRFWRR